MTRSLQHQPPSSSHRVHHIGCTWHTRSRGEAPCERPAYARPRFGDAVFLCRAHYAELRRSDALGLGLVALLLIGPPTALLLWQARTGGVEPLTVGLIAAALLPTIAIGSMAREAGREAKA